MKRFLNFFLCFLCVASAALAQENAKPNKVEKDIKVAIETSLGKIVVVLYSDTELHCKNFIKNVKDSVYNGVLFHRVIKDFMVQAGDPDSKTATADQRLGSGDLGYTVPAEIHYPLHYHKKGALAAARQGDQVNPERNSSASQFYIVTGKVLDEGSMAMMKQRMENQKKQDFFEKGVRSKMSEIRKMQAEGDTLGLQELQDELIATAEAMYAQDPVAFSDEMVKDYTTIGGTPHLDGQYTVFGEVVEGLDVVDKIQEVETGVADRPVEDVKIITAIVLE